jgi:hypothetical protein
MRLPATPLSAPALRVPALALAAFVLVVMLGRSTMRHSAAGSSGSSARPFSESAVATDSVAAPAMPKRRMAAPPMAAPAASFAAPVASDAMARGASESALQLAGAVAVVPPASDVATSMVIRTGAATIQVDSIGPAMARVRALAAQMGGFVANASLAAGGEQVRSATLELKVPTGRYDDLVNALSPIGRVETVNVSAQDVGEEYVDVAARQANAHRLEERLVTLLATRTGKLDDVLSVERELARVREEIERYEGRMRWLKAHAAVSTLTLTVHEPAPVIGTSPAANPVADAFRQAWRNCVAVVAWLVAASGIIVPLGTLALLAWPFVAARRRRAVKRAAPAT